MSDLCYVPGTMECQPCRHRESLMNEGREGGRKE